jgi:hypothetical protein
MGWTAVSASALHQGLATRAKPILSSCILFTPAADKRFDLNGIMLQFANEFSLTARPCQCDDYIDNFADNSISLDFY